MKTKQSFIRNDEKPVQKQRFIIQALFSLLVIWIGIEFHFFIKSVEADEAVLAYRPPGVEGFLPISALMSLFYWALSGHIHLVHPAGLFILVAIILVSLLFGKSFCSWLCPIGYLVEMAGEFGEKLFGRRIKPWAWLDYPLRSLKYLLFFFFAYSIFTMTEADLKSFLDSPYNVIADIKMYDFFRNITLFSFVVITALLLLSVIIRNFWCRYLCPYGALLGMISFFSPMKIKRDKISCIDCGLCTKACPSSIKVDKTGIVLSDECTSCMNCIDVCPVKDALIMKDMVTGKKIEKKYVYAAIVLTFILVTGTAMLLGTWGSSVPEQEYKRLYKDRELIDHS